MRYFTLPPEIEIGRANGNIPRFIKKWYKGKRYDITYILKLFNWAELEYKDSQAWAESTMNLNTIKLVRSKNFLHVLASSNQFKNLINDMTSELWDSLPNVVKQSLNQTYDVYKKYYLTN